MEILYLDDDLVVVNKPAGLLVHRSRLDSRETRFALQMVRNAIGQRVYPFHRLDKPTSGVLGFALSPEIANAMMQIFAAGQTRKTYLAVVRGYTEECGRVENALFEQLDRIADALGDQDKPAQAAVTDYRRLATTEIPVALGRYATTRYSLVELQPRTGRKHQLRRHMKQIFHPIVGDTSHGDGVHNRFFREHFDCHRLLLHAGELSFTHPKSGAALQVKAPLAESFVQLLTNASLELPDA